MKIKHITLILFILMTALSCGRKGGVLEIQADRESADVYLDDTLVGQTPILLEEVEPGKHILKIQKKEDGHIYEYQEVFTMPEKDDKRIEASLTRLLTEEEIDDILIEIAQTHPQPVKEDERAVIETPYGRIVIQFFPEEAPVHCANFKRLAQAGFYNGTTFHRVIPGFMIQGGDILSRDDNRYNDGTGGPGYTIPAEFNSIHHGPGIVSMARAQDPNSAGSQFFICHKDAGFLDKEYTVFGKVTEGMDVVDKIANAERDKRDNPLVPIRMKITMTTVDTLQK
jgi:peptidyl-prolyl cis-trans isomerase B (cyclophilin B)